MTIRENVPVRKARAIDRASAAYKCNPFFATTALTPWRAAVAALVIGWGMVPSDVQALPEGGEVKAGDAAIVRSTPKRLDVIQNSDKAVIDWRGFSIGGDEHTNFRQPSSSSMTLNRVTGGDPSEILGRLTANGRILLINPNGILFGAGARVDVAGLIATTADIRNEDFMAGRLIFRTPGKGDAAVVNRGQITVQEGGLVALVAPGVSNQGIIQARLGRVALGAGNTFTVDLYGDKLIQLAVDDAVLERAMSPDGEPLDSLVSNSGRITADGGTVLMTASAAKGVVDSVINMDGIVEARTVEEKGGEIALLGGDAGTVRVAGTLDASGATGGGKIEIRGENIVSNGDALLTADATVRGDGGAIVALADNKGGYAGTFSARGGAEGGDGGFVETSGKSVRVDDGISVDTSAVNGGTGNWSIDPDDLEVVAGGDEGSVDPDASTINNSTVVAQLLTTNVNLQARNSITVNAGIDSSSQTNSNTLSFVDQDANNDLTANLNAAITLGGNQRLTGEVTTANVTDGASIQNGVDVATDGATINVAAGTYGPVATSFGGAENLTIQTDAGAVIEGGDTPPSRIVDLRADGTTFQGFTVNGPGADAGVHVGISMSGRNLTVANNTVNDVLAGIQTTTQYAAGNSTVSGNTVNADYGISLQNTGNVVSGNTVTAVEEGLGVSAGTNTVSDNTFTVAPGGKALALYGVGASSVIASGNDVTVGAGANLQRGVDLAGEQGWLNMQDGAYTLSSTLDIDKAGVTVSGQSEDGTVVTAASSGYGIHVTADDVALSDFTLNGPTADAGTSYGIKVSPTGGSDAFLDGFGIANVTVSGSGRAELDLNGVRNAVIDNFNADGQGTKGAGIQIADSQDVTIRNSTTSGNDWGGVALYLTNDQFEQQLGDITIEANNDFQEANSLYLEARSSIHDEPGTLDIQGYDHVVRNPDHRPDGGNFTFFQKSLADAGSFALGFDGHELASTIEGWSGSAFTNEFFVVDGLSIGAAVDAVSAGGMVNVAAGTYVEDDQIIIDKDLSIAGTGETKPVITPGRDFTGDGADDAWLLVNSGVTFNLSNAVLDGEGFSVWQALRSHGNTTVDSVDFRNIQGSSSGSPYRGIAIQSYGGAVTGGAGSDSHGIADDSSHLVVTNSTFEQIGRIGVLVKGTEATAEIGGNTFTGKGVGDHLDYAVEIGAGGHATIANNTISDNRGIADTDGSTSAGILVTTFYGAGTEATIEGNIITDSTTAVAVGYDDGDNSVVTAHSNDLSGNDKGVKLTSAGATADFSGNWWGFTDDAEVEAYMAGGEAASVDYTPFLTSGIDVDDLTPGFQADVSELAVTTRGAQIGSTGRIQEGIDVAASGATVNVAAGTYAEDVTISRSLTLTGAGASETSGTVIQGQAGGQTAAVRIAADDVTLGGDGEDQGFRIEGAGLRAVHLAEGVSGATVQNNTIVAAENKIALDTAGDQSGHIIQGNTFTADGGTTRQLVYVNGTASLGDGRASSNVNILGNTFEGNAQLALGQEAADSRIEGNTFTGTNSYAALELWATPQTLTGNSFEGDNAVRVRMSANANTDAVDYDTSATVVASNDFATAVTNRSDTGNVAAGESAKIYGRIRTAVDDATANDTLDIAAGTYNISQTINIDRALTLNGAQTGVDARSEGPRTAGSRDESIVDGGGTLSALLRIAADDVTVDGFEFANGTGDLIDSQVAVANPMIRNNIVHGSSGDEGMQIRNSTDAVIEYNRVYDTEGDGINFDGATNGTIRFNEVHDNRSVNAAIYVYDSTNTTIQGNRVYNVSVNDGIKLGDPADGDTTGKAGGSIIDNIVENVEQDGITVRMSDVLVSGNTIDGSRSENGGIYVDTPVENVRIENNTIRDNGVSGDGRTTYAIRIGKDGNHPTNVTVSGNTFENNEAQVFHNNVVDDEIATILADNTFDRSVTISGGNAIWSAIQDGVDAAASNGTVNVGAGSYDGGITVNKQGLRLQGEDAEVTVAAADGSRGFTISADDVAIAGFDIRGPHAGDSYLDVDWSTTGNSYGIFVNNGRTGFDLTDNDISDTRTGIHLGANTGGAISGNVIENTKGAILSRTDDDNLAITGNSQGDIGNEWGLVLNLHQVGSSPGMTASAARQGEILAYSSANNGMTVLDRAYENSNRSHVSVDATSTATAADDFGFGNALGNPNQPLSSLNDALVGVVTGGFMSVTAGNYAEAFTVDKNVNMTVGSGTAQVTELTTSAGTTFGLAGTVASQGDILFDGALVLRDDVTLDTSATNADMTFNGDIDGTTVEGEDLTLDAGDGTIIAHDIGQSVALGDMTVDAGTYDASAGSTDVASLTANGTDIDVGDSTVNASQNVNLKGTNISGSVNAQNVTVQGGGTVNTKVTATNTANVSGTNVSGSVSAPTVTVKATQTANTTVTATSQANISGQNVSGSVTAPKATVTASNNVQITANVSELTAQAQSGNIDGNIGSFTVGGGGVLRIGGQSAAPLPTGVGRDRSYLDPGASGPETGAHASNGLASEAFGGGNVFGNSFSLGLAPGEVEPAAGGEDAEGSGDTGPVDFLNDFWGYYFSNQTPAEGTEESDSEDE